MLVFVYVVLFVKKWEGCWFEVYLDFGLGGDFWMIGYGVIGLGIKKGV